MDIYLITNRVSGLRYVGRTVRTAARRWSDHLSACYTKAMPSALYDDMRMLGPQQFEMKILESVDTYSALVSREIAWIETLGTMIPNGYNKVLGGTSNLGWTPSPETRERMSQGQRGRVLSPETRAKVSLSLRGNRRASVLKGRPARNIGIPHTEETKAKMRASAKGRKPGAKNRVPRSETYRANASRLRREWWASLSTEQRTAHVAKMTSATRIQS